jgi:hypothetical protein
VAEANAFASSSLTVLDLSYNYLQGSLPSALFQLPNLAAFATVHNCFDDINQCVVPHSLTLFSIDGLNQGLF